MELDILGAIKELEWVISRTRDRNLALAARMGVTALKLTTQDAIDEYDEEWHEEEE
tara:strand:- start:741 stop:908 length:168 start_codon:yes stop_codon:yes gene_type:complete